MYKILAKPEVIISLVFLLYYIYEEKTKTESTKYHRHRKETIKKGKMDDWY